MWMSSPIPSAALMVLGQAGGNKVPRKDITGVRSGKLEAVKFLYTDNTRHNVWLCKCDCGRSKEIRGDLITAKKVISCGCAKIKKRAVCKICDNPIPADSPYKDFCGDECKDKSKAINQMRFKNKGKGAKMKAKKYTLSPLDKVLADLRAYNEKNGTHLSYGQYVQMIESKQDKKSSTA